MATGTLTDFIVYSPQFWGGAVETLQENTELFNEASQNTIRLITRAVIGEYERESFLKSTAGLVAHRDVTSTAAATSTKLTQGEFVGVKLNRMIGPVEQTRDAFRKLGVDPKEFSVMLGQQAGVAIAVDYVETAIMILKAAIKNQGAALQYDATADTLKTANHAALISGQAKFGDRASRLLTFVSHSKPYFDLVKQTLIDKIVNVADVTIYQGNVATLGKPTIVLDAAALYDAAGSPLPTYDILALTEGAIEVSESEDRDILSQPVTGLQNLVDRIQGEYAFNVKVKGCAYDTVKGANPDAPVLADPTAWVKVVADNKEMPGVRITVN